jgi:glycosyltransferase involved in cell wall biosynthesis
MNAPLISCIVPVFNGERFLRESLDSILAQSCRPLEIIVADDGSTDSTAGAVAIYGEQVSYLRQANQGPAAARNFGLGAAQGEFVAFLDQDDLWHPEKLTRQLARFEARPELDVSVTHVRLFWDDDLQHEEEKFRGHRITRDLPGYITGTLLARRALFNRVGPFDTRLRYGDAMGWFLRAGEHGAIIELLPDVLLYHRMHRTNLSRREAANSRGEFLHILKASLDRKRQAGGLLGRTQSSVPGPNMDGNT